MKEVREQGGEKWITFDGLSKQWDKIAPEIMEYMRLGLKAYSIRGRRIIDPTTLPREWWGMASLYRGLKTEGGRRVFWETRKGKDIEEGPFPIEPYEEFNFTLPIDRDEADKKLAEVKTYLFKEADINEFAEAHGLPLFLSDEKKISDIKEVDNKIPTKAADFIKSLTVEYSTDATIFLAIEGEQPKEYSHQDIGFKTMGRAWKEFIEVLRFDDPQWKLPTYSRDPIEKRTYDRKFKILREFEKKFIAFINKTYRVKLPTKTKVFENQKGLNRAGIYKPLLKVKRPGADLPGIDEMSQEEARTKLKNLAAERRREKNNEKKTQLLIQMGSYLNKGKRERWLSTKEAREYLDTADDDCSSGDLTEGAYPLRDDDLLRDPYGNEEKDET